MNSKRKIKRMFSAMDDIALPSAEKMLPPEALVERCNPVRRERKPFPKFAAVGFAAVALVLAGALIVGSVAAGSGNKQAPDGDVVLKNEISAPSYDDTTVDESKVALEDMPIISCGKYTGSLSNDLSVSYEPGKVYFELMKSPYPTDMDEYLTRDDALYAVYFKVAIGDHPECAKEEIEQIEQDFRQKKNAFVEGFFSDIISKYGKEGFGIAVNGLLSIRGEESIDVDSIAKDLVSVLKDYRSYAECAAKTLNYDDYNDFCDAVINHYQSICVKFNKYFESTEALLEWRKTSYGEVLAIVNEYRDALSALRRSLHENAIAKIYEYLESQNIQVYEKTVCVASALILDGGTTYILTGDEPKSVVTHTYRVVFLTREQIKALAADENYALIIHLACDELATMENSTVYIEPTFMCD